MAEGDEPLPVIGLRLLDGRTGSTLLMQLLATSPEIVFDDRYPAEYRFLSYFRRVAELMTEPFDEGRHRGVTPFFFDPPVRFGPIPFRSDVVDVGALREPLVGGMWAAFGAELRRRHPGVRYYAEKLAVPLDAGLRAAIEVRVIDLVRDPRDVLCSMRSFTAAGHGEDGFGAAAELRTVDFASGFVDRAEAQLDLMLADDDGPHRRLVRYEDMISDLPGVAEQLGRWLGVTLDAERVVADRASYRHHVTSASPESSVSRWRSELAPAEAAMVTERLAHHLARLGYDA